MFVLDIATCFLPNGSKIGPYLMPIFVLIYSHVASSEINELQ